MNTSLPQTRSPLNWVERSSLHPSDSWFERSVRFRDRNYGPVDFTIFGPAVPGAEMQFTGVTATAESGDSMGRETLMRLTERLAVRATVTPGHVLRVLPPITEDQAVGATGPTPGEPLDGLIELRYGPNIQLRLEGEGDFSFRRGVEDGKEILDRLASEDFGGATKTGICLSASENPWRLVITLPRGWPAACVLFWGSQFLLGFFRAHAEHRSLSGSSRLPNQDSA
jgi:hypothetical protein